MDDHVSMDDHGTMEDHVSMDDHGSMPQWILWFMRCDAHCNSTVISEFLSLLLV